MFRNRAAGGFRDITRDILFVDLVTAGHVPKSASDILLYIIRFSCEKRHREFRELEVKEPCLNISLFFSGKKGNTLYLIV